MAGWLLVNTLRVITGAPAWCRATEVRGDHLALHPHTEIIKTTGLLRHANNNFPDTEFDTV